MKISAIIVDDEPISRDFLEHFCHKSGNIEVQGKFPDSASALRYLQNNLTDLIFLDVEMPGDTGFQLLDKLPVMPEVILTTSKTDYAYDAFQYKVTDYLKKPFSYVRFQESISRITLASDKMKISPEKINEDIFIKSNGKLMRLNYDEILYIQSVGDYVKYITTDKKYISHNTLKAVEEKMNKSYFMKVHRSYIVNLKKIQNIEDNTLKIGQDQIPISKILRSEVMGRLNLAS